MATHERSHVGRPRLLTLVCVLIHLGLTALLFNNVWRAVSPFDGIPFDGPFQTYNALRRIDAGQRLGQDFVVFHGVGGPLVQYPYFKLLGSDIAASEITRLFLRRLQVILVILLFSWFFRLGWLPSLLLWPLALGIGVRGYLFQAASHNLLEFRSLFPIIVAGFIVAPRDIPFRSAWIGVASAFALLCGTEHGVAVIVAAGISVVVAAAASRHKPVAWSLLKETSIGLSLGVLLMLLVWFASGGPSAVVTCMKFYFVELVNDQFWYFGVPPNRVFYGQWRPHERFYAVAIASPIAFCLSWVAYRKATTETSCRLAIGLMTLFAYSGLAAISYLGIATNVQPSIRAILAAGVCIAITAWNRRFGAAGYPGSSTFWWRTTIFALIAVSPLIITPVYRALNHVGYSQGHKHDFATVAQITGAIPDDPGKVKVWSDYAGAIEDHLSIFHPHTDYLIHALGPDRRASYLRKFEEVKPDFVIASAPTKTYTPWLWQSFWGFYRNLVFDYEVVGRTRHMLIWKRKPTEVTARQEAPWTDATTADEGQTYQVPCPREPGKIPLMEIKVSYSYNNPFVKIPVLGKLPRLFVYPTETINVLPVSLPPYENEFVFPASPAGKQDIQLRYGVESITPGTSLRIHSVQARVIAQLDPDHQLIRPEVDNAAN